MEVDLERAARAYRRAQDAAERRRLELAEVIAKAGSTGMKQVDIVRITGYTREHVRRIVNATKVD
jgi:CRP-like cAMP-binding protein